MKTADYSKTVLLPKTAFSMRADLPRKEPGMLKFWEKIDLYRKMLDARKEKPVYVLHDGPPYANGHIHIGHAFNKILKDMVVKSRAMSGHFAPYVPGWDCHGLPIEQQLLKELKMGKRHVENVPEFRKKARNFAAKFIDIQRGEFKRLGVFGQWDNPYMTMSPEYEGTVLEAFRQLLGRGYIYRDKKTIYWCISCETALADAEVEYKDKISDSIYVKFELCEDSNPHPTLPQKGRDQGRGPVSLVIWTTTPWTLPANRASAVAMEEDYVFIRDDSTNEHYIVAEKLADSFIRECGLPCAKCTKKVKGLGLVGLKYRHPLFDRTNPVVHTDFVDMDTGTGIVHMAPGHGEEDFRAAKKWGLEVFCPVDERGKFTEEAGGFKGLEVFKANRTIIETLQRSGNLLGRREISHSYPHCWRCKRPIVFRATEQWFLGVDVKDLRKACSGETGRVRWVPPSGRERMSSTLQARPDWCLSRQRYWGTPIPVLYCKSCKKPQTEDSILELAVSRALREGADFWFEDDAGRLVPGGYKCSCGSAEFVKEKDILDVWLDSGVSWLAVLKNRHCQLYLEGSDQHRGWFQTSLIPSVALQGKAPYDTVLTHGMVLDEHGKAMHKSMGNVVSPQEIVSKYGADVLRLWVALSDYSDDVRLSTKALEGAIDTYRKIRNTIRYLLGNIWDYDPRASVVPYEKLLETDRYMLCRLAGLVESVTGDYNAFKFRRAVRSMADFCILDLSAFYMDSLKDRLYTLKKDSLARRSCQSVLYDIAVSVVKLMAPVLSFTAEEAWQLLRDEGTVQKGRELAESVFLEDFPQVHSQWLDKNLSVRWTRIMEIREKVLKALEDARRSGIIGSSLEAKVTFRTSDMELNGFLSDTIGLWPSISIVSSCVLPAEQAPAEGDTRSGLEINVSRAEGAKCPRCWQWKTDICADSRHPELCARCASVLE